MIKRMSRYAALEKMKENPTWNIVDLGSGTRGACPLANVLVDQQDWSSSFKGREFVVHDVNTNPLPFKDNQFDFCWASHILEHVRDPMVFLSEIVRISKAGYIEVPTPLIDNMVSGDDINDPSGHKWWVYYDDTEEELVLRPRRHILQRSVDSLELNKLYPFFRSSFVIELYWEGSINVTMEDEKYFYEDKNYDLSQEKINPWVMGSDTFNRHRKMHG